ncbi:hypothetical protein [Candidatus Enterovibrio escicola]|uniref:hypothetical protein n=1 Tax=Candidatus Enterovibrio escicola TaxID=1927127 RepID=UPI000BE2E996|nr:hypothetical protein [Candidatus Enterovibrio escacola]
MGIKKWFDITNEKTEFYHFDIDTVLETWLKSFLLTVMDKVNELCYIRKMPTKQADTVVKTFIDIVNSTSHDFKNLTSNNGITFTCYKGGC